MSNITNGKKMAIIKLFLNLRTIQKERSEKHNWKEITVGDNSFLQQGGIQEKKINADRKYYYNVITEEIKYERPEIMKTTYQEYESIERITETQIISFIENLNFDELKAISKTIEDEIDQLENTTKKEKKFVEQLKTLKRALQAEEREEQRIREISQTQDDDSGKEKEKPTTIYFQKSNNKIGINRKLKPGDVWESLSFNIFHEKKWQKVFIEPLSKTAVKMVNEGHIRLRNKKAISNELDIDREIKSNLQIVQQKMYKLNTQTKDGARRLQNIRAIIWAEMQRILKPGAKIKLGKGTERDISNKVAELLGGWHWELFKKQNRFKKQELLQLKRMINVVNPELLIDKDARTQDILEIEKGFQISMTEVADDRHRGRPRTTTRVEMDPPIDLGKIRTTILSNPKSSASNSTSKILNEEELFERNFKKANLRVDMTFPYFDAQTSEFEEYVTILGREYNTEAKEWNVQLETIYGILKRRIYKVVEGMREGKRIEQERVEFMEAVERYELSKGQRFPLVDDSGRLIRKGKVIGFGWFEGRWGVDVQDEDNPKVGVLNKKPRKMNNSRKEGMKKHFSPLLANALITDSGQIPETFPFAYNSDHYENEAKVVDFEFKDSMSQIVLAKKNGKNFYRGTLDNVIKGIDDGRTERRRRDNVSGQGTKKNPYTLSDDEYDNVSGQGTKNNAITDLEQLVGFNPVGKFIDVSVHAVGGLIGQAAPNIQTITAIEYAGVQDDNKHKFKIFTQSRPNPGNIINQDFTYTTEETVRRVKWGTQFRRGQGTKNNPYTLSDDEYDNVSGQGTKNNPYTLSDDESDNVSGQGTKNNPYTLSEDEYDNVSEDEYDNVSEDEYDNVSGQGTKKNPYTLSEDEYDNVSGQGTKNNPYTLSEDEYDNVSEDEYDNVSGQGTRNNPYTLSEDEYDNVSEDESDNVSGQGTKKNPYTLSEDESDNVSPVSGRIAYDDDYVEDITDQELQRRQDQRDERIANAPYVSGSDGDGANPIEHSYNDIAPNVPLLTDDDDYVEDITDQELQRRQAQRDERIANETVDLVSEDGNVLDQFYRNIQGQGLQALTFEKPATNKKFIMYIGRLTRFRGKTGVISYRRLVKYKKPKRPFFVQWLTEEHKTRIQFKVTWDNAQLRDSEKSQFNKEEFDYLMAHLKDEMKEIDEYSIERSYSENQLIPIDELNFQKEMYNKDTSTLVVAEASASKPGLSPASIPSGELSAMLAELSSMDNTESEYASQSEYASESEVEEPLETGWKSDDFASSDFASESGDNSSELSN